MNRVVKEYETDINLLAIREIIELFIGISWKKTIQFYQDRISNMIEMIANLIEKDQLGIKGYDIEDVIISSKYIYVKGLEKDNEG